MDTTNFNGRGVDRDQRRGRTAQGSRKARLRHLVEALHAGRRQHHQLHEVTIDDPEDLHGAWKVAFPLNKDERYQIFSTCHEGNYALGNMLRLGAADKKASRLLKK